MKRISNNCRSSIISLVLQGLSTRKISAQLGISRSTVSRIRKEALPNAKLPSKGRPRTITLRQETLLIRSLTSGKIDTAVDAQKELFRDHCVNVSAQTVRNMFKKKGLKSSVKKKKPFLNIKHRRQRLEFARKYQHWTIDDWKRVIFSDETKVCRLGSDGRKWCWKIPGSALQSNLVNPTVKFGGGSIMVWGCMPAKGVGFLAKIDTIMDSNIYCKILEEDLMSTLRYYHLDPQEIVFQHDNDPKHRAKKTQEWLKDNNIEVLDWPAQSPDLNPIENLWSYFKHRLSDKDSSPTSMHDLWLRMEEEWNLIDANFCAKLIESMPGRIAEVIKAKGGYICY
jgi:transposase